MTKIFAGHKTAVDGRWITAGFLLTYFGLLFVLSLYRGRVDAWFCLAVPAEKWSFLDLRGLIWGAQSYQDGLDPIIHNVHDPMGRGANYPHLWFWPLMILHLDEGSAVPLGIGCSLVFYACTFLFAGRLNLAEGVAWGFCLCAPPTMLAVERGNNDLLIFSLIAVALVVRRTAGPLAAVGSYALIELCALLKLFPFAAFYLILREKLKLAAALLCVWATLFFVYLYVIRDQVKAIKSVIPHVFANSFGRNVWLTRFGSIHPLLTNHHASWLALSLLVVLAGLGWLSTDRLPAGPQWKTEGLMVGSVLYVVTFALNNNFNYRLIFLLFTIPALLQMLGGRGFYQKFAALLASCLVVSWTLSMQMQDVMFDIKELANWAVFAGMIFLGLKCLPPLSHFYGHRPENV